MRSANFFYNLAIIRQQKRNVGHPTFLSSFWIHWLYILNFFLPALRKLLQLDFCSAPTLRQQQQIQVGTYHLEFTKRKLASDNAYQLIFSASVLHCLLHFMPSLIANRLCFSFKLFQPIFLCARPFLHNSPDNLQSNKFHELPPIVFIHIICDFLDILPLFLTFFKYWDIISISLIQNILSYPKLHIRLI